jgi:hypothetical protein
MPGGAWERTGKPVRMVTEESATWFTCDEETHNQIPLNADHSNLVKFTGKADPNYLHVLSKFKHMVKKAHEIGEHEYVAKGPAIIETYSASPAMRDPGVFQQDEQSKATNLAFLIVETFHAYQDITNLRARYKHLDRLLERYLKEIDVQYELFTGAINHLLLSCGDTKAGSLRRRMLANLQDENWKRESLSSQMRSALGENFSEALDAINGVKETIKSTEAKLMEVPPNGTDGTFYVGVTQFKHRACRAID